MEPIQGMKPAGTVDHGVEIENAKIGNAATLQELQGDYAFYTMALAVLCCPLPEDPLVTLAKQLDRRFKHFTLKFDRPVFAQLPHEFGHILYGIERAVWSEFENLLKGISCIDRGRRMLSQLRLKKLTIADPLELQRRGFSSGLTTEVVGICVETNYGCSYFDDSAGLQSPPVFRYTSETFPDFVALANTLLGPA